MIREWHRPLTPENERNAENAARVLIEKGVLQKDDPKDLEALRTCPRCGAPVHSPADVP